MPLPPADRLSLSDAERKQLMALGHHRSSPRGIVLRINIVLGAGEGLANRVLARKLSTSVPTVLLWRKRFESDGITGILEDRPREWASQTDLPRAGSRDCRGYDEDDSERCHAMERARDGCSAEGQFRDGAADLEEAQTAAASCRVVQIQQRPTVCTEGSRHRRALCEPAR